MLRWECASLRERPCGAGSGRGFFCSCHVGFFLVRSIQWTSENPFLHWQGDATGKKTAFQATSEVFLLQAVAWEASAAFLLAVDDAFERLGIQNPHMALFDFDNAIVDKLREGATDGFEFEAQVAADFLAASSAAPVPSGKSRAHADAAPG